MYIFYMDKLGNSIKNKLKNDYQINCEDGYHETSLGQGRNFVFGNVHMNHVFVIIKEDNKIVFRLNIATKVKNNDVFYQFYSQNVDFELIETDIEKNINEMLVFICENISNILRTKTSIKNILPFETLSDLEKKGFLISDMDCLNLEKIDLNFKNKENTELSIEIVNGYVSIQFAEDKSKNSFIDSCIRESVGTHKNNYENNMELNIHYYMKNNDLAIVYQIGNGHTENENQYFYEKEIIIENIDKKTKKELMDLLEIGLPQLTGIDLTQKLKKNSDVCSFFENLGFNFPENICYYENDKGSFYASIKIKHEKIDFTFEFAFNFKNNVLENIVVNEFPVYFIHDQYSNFEEDLEELKIYLYNCKIDSVL